MRACSVCARLYPDDAAFCAEDGTALRSSTEVPATSDAEDPRVGSLLADRYEFRRVVADGGMGRVYEALDLVERRNVAIKVLHPSVAKDAVAVQRFLREFEVSGLLPHAHVVEVRDFLPTPDGSHALVMEFLYGEELRALLKRETTMAPYRLVRMVSQLALGLDAAHERQLVHRDLKPDNIFLCQTREGDLVKILDFGSVKDKKASSAKLTVLGTTIGSPFYMSPEQAQGLDTLDHRADVWSLAAILYEAVTGTVPFSGTNGPSILLAILTKQAIPASQAAAGRRYPVPVTLDRALERGLAKPAMKRTASAGELADAVGAAFGLEGNHRQWAYQPQSELRERIGAKLPELLANAPAAEPEDAARAEGFDDDFFADSERGGVRTAPRARAGRAAAPSARAVPEPAVAPPNPSASLAGARAPSLTGAVPVVSGGAAAGGDADVAFVPVRKGVGLAWLALGALAVAIVIGAWALWG